MTTVVEVVDYTQKIYPTQCMTFWEVMEFLGFEEKDREFYSDAYATIAAALESLDFSLLCYDRDFHPIFTHDGLFGYMDEKHIDICPVAADLYLVTWY